MSLNIIFFNFIIIFIFQIKLIYSHNIQCPYSNCLSCIMCKAEEIKDGCYCTWNSDDRSCTTLDIEYPLLDEWYYEIEKCNDNEDKIIYCPNKKNYTVDDFEDGKIIINIKKDKNNKYGSYFSYCQFEFNDEKGESYDIKINYTINSKLFIPPKIVLYSSYKEDDIIKENIEEIKENYTKYFGNLYKLKYMILLKDQYKVMPSSLTISKPLSGTKNSFMSILAFVFAFAILGAMIYYNIRRYLRRKKMREELILLRAQRDLQYVQPYQINIGIDQDTLKRNNTMKVNTLFDTILVEHLYKEEYNQYGGGCSICLENFNKKSKVAITPCKHVFHYKCIHEWVFKNILCPKCPNCNHEILKEKEDDNNILKEKDNYDNINNEENCNNNNPQIIQINKKQNNNRNGNEDASSQNQILVNGNAINIVQRNDNKSQNSKRKMLKKKKNQK